MEDNEQAYEVPYNSGPVTVDNSGNGWTTSPRIDSMLIRLKPDEVTVSGLESVVYSTVQVNGSGRVSRWYFRSTGELESIELPGKLQRVESDLHALRVDFGRDGQMSP